MPGCCGTLPPGDLHADTVSSPWISAGSCPSNGVVGPLERCPTNTEVRILSSPGRPPPLGSEVGRPTTHGAARPEMTSALASHPTEDKVGPPGLSVTGKSSAVCALPRDVAQLGISLLGLAQD